MATIQIKEYGIKIQEVNGKERKTIIENAEVHPSIGVEYIDDFGNETVVAFKKYPVYSADLDEFLAQIEFFKFVKPNGFTNYLDDSPVMGMVDNNTYRNANINSNDFGNICEPSDPDGMGEVLFMYKMFMSAEFQTAIFRKTILDYCDAFTGHSVDTLKGVLINAFDTGSIKALGQNIFLVETICKKMGWELPR